MTIQVQSIILPQIWIVGNEVETINDLVTHPSVDVEVAYLQNKVVQITATEAITVGVPGNLLCWIELSPIISTTTDAYYSAIGGGGGPLDPATGLPYIPPAAPVIEVPLGINGTIHTIVIPWIIHSRYARLVVQTPVAATPLTANWTLQAMFSGNK